MRGRALSTVVLLLSAACARDVTVGREDAVVSEAGAAGGGGEANSGGAPTGGAAGDATGGQPSPGDLLWSADHERGTFDEWLSDGSGISYVQGSGELAVTTEHAHSGSSAFVATISAEDGELHQANMGREVALLEGRYGAWYYLPQPVTASTWVIMKLSNGPSTDRFDIDLNAPEGEPPRLRLYEHPDGWITDAAPITFPIGQWVHVEALYRSTPNADGRLIVLQDGEQVLDTGPRPTASDDRVGFYCGSAARWVQPVPARLFIDDASIQVAAVP